VLGSCASMMCAVRVAGVCLGMLMKQLLLTCLQYEDIHLLCLLPLLFAARDAALLRGLWPVRVP
jgi:hypothetical protein